jgi:hypothetical protein
MLGAQKKGSRSCPNLLVKAEEMTLLLDGLRVLFSYFHGPSSRIIFHHVLHE